MSSQNNDRSHQRSHSSAGSTGRIAHAEGYPSGSMGASPARNGHRRHRGGVGGARSRTGDTGPTAAPQDTSHHHERYTHSSTGQDQPTTSQAVSTSPCMGHARRIECPASGSPASGSRHTAAGWYSLANKAQPLGDGSLTHQTGISEWGHNWQQGQVLSLANNHSDSCQPCESVVANASSHPSSTGRIPGQDPDSDLDMDLDRSGWAGASDHGGTTRRLEQCRSSIEKAEQAFRHHRRPA